MEAYEGLWEVITEQSISGDLDDSALERYAEDQALDFAREQFDDRAEAGEVARGEPVIAPEVAEIDAQAENVEIHDCLDTTDWLREDAETGELVEPIPEQSIRRQVEATVEFDGLAWRVTELLLGQVGSC